MNAANLIGFPGFNIGPFEISPIAVNIFGRDIAWYGIFISIAFFSGILYSFWRGNKEGIKPDDMIDIALFSIPSAIIGARLYYVVFKHEYFNSFYDIIAIWEGGLAVYGGIIFGFLTAFCVSLYKKISVFKVLDSVSPSIMIGQAIGRWGNFTNAEAYGSITDLPWRMSIQGINSNYTLLVHPTFLYESLWNITGFVLLNLFFKKKKFDGEIFLMYISWYGFGRMLIEGLRTDSLYLGSIRVSQMFGGICFIVGIAVITTIFIKLKNKTLLTGEYENIYSQTGTDIVEMENNENSNEPLSNIIDGIENEKKVDIENIIDKKMKEIKERSGGEPKSDENDDEEENQK